MDTHSSAQPLRATPALPGLLESEDLMRHSRETHAALLSHLTGR